MPNQGETPNRNFRCPDDLWEAVVETAAANDETASDVIRAALRLYLGDAS